MNPVMPYPAGSVASQDPTPNEAILPYFDISFVQSDSANISASMEAVSILFIDWEKSNAVNIANELSQSDEVGIIFSGLAKKWQKETRHFSIIGKRYQHEAYQKILQMDKEVLPWILNSLRRDPDRWFAALEEISGENPAEGASNFYEAVDRWVSWGISSRLIK